jgi:hypothetical protein
VARLTSSPNPAPGVTVALLPGSHPDLYLQDTGSETVTVLGQQGEPFAQIGSHGVRVNLRSPIHAADATSRGQRPEVTANPAARPLWRRVSSTGTYDWLDPRPRVTSRWAIPILVGTRRLAVTGALSAPPPVAGAAVSSGVAAPIGASGAAGRTRGGSSGALWAGLVVLIVLAVCAVWARMSRVRRRVRT